MIYEFGPPGDLHLYRLETETSEEPIEPDLRTGEKPIALWQRTKKPASDTPSAAQPVWERVRLTPMPLRVLLVLVRNWRCDPPKPVTYETISRTSGGMWRRRNHDQFAKDNVLKCRAALGEGCITTHDGAYVFSWIVATYADVGENATSSVSATQRDHSIGTTRADAIDCVGLVSDLRSRILPHIQERCGRVRLPATRRFVDLDKVYVEVPLDRLRTLLPQGGKEELTSTTNTIPCLPGTTDWPDTSEEGETEHQGTSHRGQRVIVYGRPGGGKSTLLKRIAMECARGAFCPGAVPAFVALRDFVASRALSLSDYIARQWKSERDTLAVLRDGRALILLDGLDDVSHRDFTAVCAEIRTFADDYTECFIVLTCRTGQTAYTFDGFVEAQIYDLFFPTIRAFVARWFAAQETKRNAILRRLIVGSPLERPAGNPLFLTLLCIVFEQYDDFDGAERELFKRYLDFLTWEWDASQGSEREWTGGLSGKEVQVIVRQIAYKGFSLKQDAFSQHEIEKEIEALFSKLHPQEPPWTLRSKLVVDAIESQLGLIAATEMGYQFVHDELRVCLAAEHASSTGIPPGGIEHSLRDRDWRHIWKWRAAIAPDLGNFARETKRNIDSLIATQMPIQRFLAWCAGKAESQGTGNLRAVLRCAAFSSALRTIFSWSYPSHLSDFFRALGWHQLADRHLLDKRPRLRYRIWAEEVISDVLVSIGQYCALHDHCYSIFDQNELWVEDKALYGQLMRTIDSASEKLPCAKYEDAAVTEMACELRRLKDSIPSDISDRRVWRSRDLKEVFCTAAEHHFGFTPRWSFSEEQLDLLEHYYWGHLLLIESLSGAKMLRPGLRQEIESTFFLPKVED